MATCFAAFNLLLHFLDLLTLFFDLVGSLRGTSDLLLLPCRISLLNLLHFLSLLLRLHVPCNFALDIPDRALSAFLLLVSIFSNVLD